MQTSYVLSWVISLMVLALLMTKNAWALGAFDRSDSCLIGSPVCGHLSKRRLSKRGAGYMAWDLDLG